MSEPATATRSDDAHRGRETALRVAENWPHADGLVEHVTAEFANAAVERLAELIAEQPALFQASRRGSERGAESLSARPFQGIVESIQNGDDLDASELRLALRLNGERRELLIVHNGAPISLVHVAAMMLPWVTTKIDDPRASGRFGIGQKTLRALGGPIDAHCDPYHFRMDEIPAPCPPEPAIDGFYDPAARETLLVVPLHGEVDVEALKQFTADLGTRALVFLRSIRRVALIDLKTGVALVDHRLQERQRRNVELDVTGHRLEVEIVQLIDRSRGQTYTRYLAEMPLRSEERRHNKATGPTTMLGVCVPREPEQELLYDRLPLPVPCDLPVGLNAQFDPDTARSTLHERSWNAHRFAELGDFLAAVAVELFTRDPRRAWGAVPLLQEVPDGIGEWLRERFLIDVIGRCHVRLGDEVRLGPQEDPRPLDEIVFEEADLEAVLTESDQERLADGFRAVPSSQRDRPGRWRGVLQELGRSRLIEVEDALELLEHDDAELGERTGTFTLTHEVHWQNAVVPAGKYRFTVGANGPVELLTLSKLTGSGAGFMLLATDVRATQPSDVSQLVVVSRANGSFVRTMQLPEFGITLHFVVPAETREVAQTVATAAGTATLSSPTVNPRADGFCLPSGLLARVVIPSKRSYTAKSLSRACRGNRGEPRDASQPALSEAEGFFATQ